MLEHIVCVTVENAGESSQVPLLWVFCHLLVNHLCLRRLNEQLTRICRLKALYLVPPECFYELIDEARYEDLDCVLEL